MDLIVSAILQSFAAQGTLVLIAAGLLLAAARGKLIGAMVFSASARGVFAASGLLVVAVPLVTYLPRQALIQHYEAAAQPASSAQTEPVPPLAENLPDKTLDPPAGPLPTKAQAAQSLRDLVRAHLQRFADSAFLPPSAMLLGGRREVSITMPEQFLNDITDDLVAYGFLPADSALVSRSVMVRLLDNTAFHIAAEDDDEQPVVDATDWSWDIVPQQHGQQDLKLRIVVKVLRPGGLEQKIPYDVPRPISVQWDPGYAVTSFFETYWQWLAEKLVIPLVTGLLGWWARGYMTQPPKWARRAARRLDPDARYAR